MDDAVESVSWEAPEHNHIPKDNDWYWALGILTIGGVFAAILLGNALFAILLGVAGLVLAIFATQEPKIITFAVTARGVRIGDTLFPYNTLASHHIDEEHPAGPQLLLKPQRTIAPLLVIPIPPEQIEEITELLTSKLPDEYLEEPFINQILEFLGF